MIEYQKAHEEDCVCDRRWYELTQNAVDDRITFITEKCVTCGRLTWPEVVAIVPKCDCFAAQCELRNSAKIQPASFTTTICQVCGGKTLPVVSE